MKKRSWVHPLLMVLLMIYLLSPLAATLLYSLAGEWQTTVLPEYWTLHWFADMLQDPRFTGALLRTLLVCTVTVVLSMLVMLPTIFIVTVYFPRFERLLNALVLLPYAIPPVVAAVGLIKIYSSGPIVISGTVWILIGGYFVSILPYMYQGIRNSLRTIHAVELLDAAELLGASKIQAFRHVVFPNILPGIMVSMLLSFSVLFGEFVLANLLVGGHFPTIQIYLYQRLSESGHLASAIAITYFIVVLLVSGVLLKLSKWFFRAPRLG
ncbi:ABC transporter permease [Ferviditalea candida]|uniref:ABC transporter permease subunit n=1 Tax=Ferviditalea candida TaxID=3108399 RepID=A0ABU5ZIY6_9BACL|nr:ABC transporter permease subunit [Paenibacillaceae bacterium T2]